MILAIDQGTTSSRAIAFDTDGRPVRVSQQEFPQIYPQNGWVEHDPEAIWRTTLDVAREAMDDRISAIGITNQRETIVLWDRESGRPLHNAIVWQDRRTAELCASLKQDGVEPMVQAKTGLLLDPYFSGTKLKYLLDTVPGARDRAVRGELAAGTIDTFLLWRLTGGRVHATDLTNAGRTLLCNIHTAGWDEDLLRLLEIPSAILPEIRENANLFGETDPSLFGRRIPIAGMAGDQQSALIGQACFAPGMVKSTYGTGCFMLMNIGRSPVASTNRLLTTPAYRIGGETIYALEGSIFVAGAAVKWLRDKAGLVPTSDASEAMARAANPHHGVVLVPAFVGLGAPHWAPDARGLISGLTLDTGANELVRATLESIAYQTRDLTDAMARDGASSPAALRIDGGMSQNGWFAQFLSDMLDVPVERPISHETTAWGAAVLAGLTTGCFADLADVSARWSTAARYEPDMSGDEREHRLSAWHSALGLALRPA
jgi:glycerol kinase